ncbi:hypothetical protein JOE58_000487 [Curtobacterium luteum]|uniref:Uncharacterized protein n=1 Tax=Curtobacterium luteum TaxID=33881 RepID=A0ABS2RQI8_9MICO|nr:hypothetical protein [Curtobacterium luteum]
MGHEDHRLAEFALQADQFVLQVVADEGVDGAERLVHEQDVRVDREPTRHADALLLATGELRGVAVRERPVEADRVHELERALARLRLADTRQQRHGRDVVDHAAVRQEPGVLHDVADPPAELDRVDRRDVLAVDGHRPRRRVHHAVDHPEEGRLAATARPDEDRRGSGGYDEVEVLDRGGAVRVRLPYRPELDHGGCPSVRR